MLTSWGKRIVGIAKSSGILPYPTISSTSKAYIPAKSVAGNDYYINSEKYSSVSWALLNVAVRETGNAGVIIGSGNRQESENDYTLENQILGITAPSPQIVTFFDDVKFKYVARLDYVISNDTGAEITIREIGLLGHYLRAEQQGATPPGGAQYRYTFLIDRTLLDEPVVIANGDAGTVRYEFAY